MQRPGLCAGGKFNARLPEPSAECRIKKLIIYSFADSNRSAPTADDSSTNADVFPSAPLAQNPFLCLHFLILKQYCKDKFKKEQETE